MSLRTLKQYITDDPGRLSSQLADLENNVVTETESIRNSYLVRPTPTARVIVGGGIYTVGQAVTIDTSAGSYAVNLAVPADRRPGWLYFIHVTSGTLTLRPINATINNAATLTHAVVGVLSVYFDGAKWWS